MARMSKEQMRDNKNKILNLLRDDDLKNESGITPMCFLIEETGLTENQVKSVIHSMRMESFKDEKFLKYYPIMKSKGYKLPDCINDYLEMYCTMVRHAISRFITIKPIRQYLKSQGVDVTKEYNKIKEEYKNKDFDPDDTDRFFVTI